MQKLKRKHSLLLVLLTLSLVAVLVLALVACQGQIAPPDDSSSDTDVITVAPSDPETPTVQEPDDTSSKEPGDSEDVSNDTSRPAEDTSRPAEDSEDEVITRAPVITLPPLDSDVPATSEPEETLPYDPSLHPGNSADYKGVMISAVYGTGKKNTDAAMESGFVQLYNTSMYTVSLKGASLYYKSDGAAPFDQFVFPDDAVIAPGGYYLVKCNSVAGYDQSMAVIGMEYYDAEWDTTFDNHEIRLLLAPSGWAIGRDENILLFDDAISVFVATESYNESVYAVDGMSKNKIAVRTALKDYSGYHTVNLAERATGELQKVAPAASGNRVNPVIAPRINEVTFSQPAGVYDTAFNLSLTAKSGYKIYYTTDGSDPTVSGKQYTGAIKLADSSKMTWGPTIKASSRYITTPSSSTLIGGYVIKAYATNGTESTPVYTNTYFIIPELCDYGVTVMSISMPVDEIFGDEGFYNNYLLTGSITGGRRRGTAIMEVFDTNGNRVGNSTVELAVSGNGSSGAAMKSLRIYYKGALNEDGGREGNLDYDLFEGRAKDHLGQAITTFDRLLLRNSGNDCGHSYIRDAYMQRVCADTNVDYMESASTLVFINGEFWGVYNIRERYSPEYVESHYGVDKENVALIESDYSQVHTNHMADYVVSSGIEGDADSFNAMTAYMREHDLSDPAAYAYVCTQMDIDSFIDMWVVRLFFNARDWPENNMKVWRNRNPEDPSGFDTKWHFTLLDMDMGLSYFPANDGANTTEGANFFWFISNSGSVCGQMMRDLLKNPDFKEQFILRYYEVVNDYLTADYLSAEFEAMVAERDPLMPLQVVRWRYSLSTWNSDVSDIRSFVANRTKYALSFFYNFFGISESDIENISSRRVTISYNPERVSVYINGESVSNGTQFRFEDKEREFEVSVTVKAGYTLNGIVWTSNSGNTQREDTSTKVTFKITSSGTISIYAKRDKTGPADMSGEVIAGPTYMFYLTGNGDLYAWGDNRGGVLALGSEGGTVSTPTFVMSNVAKVSTTQGAANENGDMVWMTAILTKDGKLYTVGRNTCGQLGRNGTADDTRLDLVSFNGKIVDVSVGYDHMLIIDDKGVMWGIGSNTYGQLGTKNQGGTTQTFQKIAENVSMISAGRRSTAFVDDNGKLYGLGDNRWKKLSQKHGDTITTPTLMLENVVYVDSGEHQMLAVTENGDLYYAGWRAFNSFAQGDGNNPTLRKVMGGVEKADIYFSNLIILTENGDAYVYGLNQDGGIGSSAVIGGTPKKIYSGVINVAAGYGFTVYYCEDGSIRILGDNTYGQGGTGKAGGRVDFSEADV